MLSVFILCISTLFLTVILGTTPPEFNLNIPPECHNNKTTNTRILPGDYQKGRLPPIDNGPVNVSIEVSVNDILLVDESKKIIRIQLSLLFSWVDLRFLVPRLFCKKYYQFVDKDAIRFLWTPDLWIDRLHAAESLQGAMLTTAGNMQMWRNRRLSITLPFNIEVSCKMEFYTYPMDTQYCLVQLMSYGYNTKKNQYEWSGKGLRVRPGITLNRFDVNIVKLPGTKISDYLGEYPTLAFVVILDRNFGDQFLSLYVPSTLFILAAWLSLLVPPSQVPGRMTLCVTVLLTTVALFAYSRSFAPSVSYSTAMDIWMVMSIAMVFLALLEFVLVVSLRNREDHNEDDLHGFFSAPYLSRKVEVGGIIVFPLIFGLFCIGYWSYYLSFFSEMPDMKEQLED